MENRDGEAKEMWYVVCGVCVMGRVGVGDSPG